MICKKNHEQEYEEAKVNTVRTDQHEAVYAESMASVELSHSDQA